MNYKRFPLGALWTNGFLIWDNQGNAFFVDPGGDAEDVLNFLKENNLKLQKVLLTHGHLDHIAGVRDLEPLVGDEVYVGRGDAGLLREPPSDLQKALRIHCEPIPAFHELSEGDVLTIGSINVKVLETPGHTEGGLCYFITDSANNTGTNSENLLAVGDTLFAQSVGRTDLDGGNPDKLNNSLKRLIELPDDLHVLPGHGPETDIGREKARNPFLRDLL